MRKTRSRTSRRETAVAATAGWGGYYDKYANAQASAPGDDPMFEVVFRTDVELDVPLPQANDTGMGTPLGGTDPVSQHVPGAGATKGGIPEGLLPPSPIEIVDIRPVGTPRASYPSQGGTFHPFPPGPRSVRNLPAPIGGASAGPGSQTGGRDED